MNDHLSFTTKTLREFGLLVGGIIAGLFGTILPLLKGHSLPLWAWIIGGVLILLGLFLPKSLAPIYKLWMRLGLMLGWVNSRIILGVIFFLIMTPMGLI
ncbi:MAG: SxtJ family membrane protein, partial [Microcystaceae cyanobacterium]